MCYARGAREYPKVAEGHLGDGGGGGRILFELTIDTGGGNAEGAGDATGDSGVLEGSPRRAPDCDICANEFLIEGNFDGRAIKKRNVLR